MLVGQKVRLTATVYDTTRSPPVPADPTDLALKVRDGSGNVTTLLFSLGQVMRDGIGVYHADYQTAVAGTHVAHWSASGATVAVAEARFTVDAGAVA